MDNVTIVDTGTDYVFHNDGEYIGRIDVKFNGYGWINAHYIENDFYKQTSCDTWEGAYTEITTHAGFSTEDEMFWPTFESVFTYSEDD